VKPGISQHSRNLPAPSSNLCRYHLWHKTTDHE